MHFFIGLFTVILVLASLFMILVILMQRPRSDSGLGAALGGGGAAESAFGADTANVLTKTTIYCCIFFFVVSFGLYLGHMKVRHQPLSDLRALPEISEPERMDEPVVPRVDDFPSTPEEAEAVAPETPDGFTIEVPPVEDPPGEVDRP